MPRKLAYNTKLDQQVRKYLEEPMAFNDVMEYSINRGADGLTALTVKVFVDPERFDKEEE